LLFLDAWCQSHLRLCTPCDVVEDVNARGCASSVAHVTMPSTSGFFEIFIYTPLSMGTLINPDCLLTKI
jgi:hypothetical protein